MRHEHGDLEDDSPEPNSMSVCPDIERVLLSIVEFHQVDAGQIAIVRDHAFGDHGVRDGLGDVIDHFLAVRHDLDDLWSARILQRADERT